MCWYALCVMTGGAIFLHATGAATAAVPVGVVEQCTFNQSSAAHKGGAIMAVAMPLYIRSSSFLDNIAVAAGNLDSPRLTACRLAIPYRLCLAFVPGGGGVFSSHATTPECCSCSALSAAGACDNAFESGHAQQYQCNDGRFKPVQHAECGNTFALNRATYGLHIASPPTSLKLLSPAPERYV